MAQWSTPVQIPNQTSNDAPTLVTIGGRLYLLRVDENTGDVYQSVFNGSSWSTSSRTFVKSAATVAAAADGQGRALMVFPGGDPYGGAVFTLFYSTFNGTWSARQPLPKIPEPNDQPYGYGVFSPITVALLYTPSYWLVVRRLIAQSQMDRIYFDGTNPAGHEPVPNQTTKTTTALASYQGQIHLLHLGDTSNNIWHSVNFGPNVRVPDQTSKATPAMAVYGGVLHMVHLGNSSNDIWHSTYNGQWTPNVRLTGQTSAATPALAATADALHMVYRGVSSKNLYHSIYR
ncbi:MAG TPA: hypothetical protein VF546_12460 [Pyrinomonadaceae bacterium]|jgi:hypothetical protein